MRIPTTFRLTSTIPALLGLLEGVYASSSITVLSDTIALCNAATTLNNAELGYPATGLGSFTLALGVHNDHVAFIKAINTTALDATSVSPSPIGAADSASICNTLTGCAPTIQSIFNRYVVLEPAWARVPINGWTMLVKIDIHNLTVAITALENVLNTKLDTGAQPCLNTFQSTVDPAAASAIVAYN